MEDALLVALLQVAQDLAAKEVLPLLGLMGPAARRGQDEDVFEPAI